MTGCPILARVLILTLAITSAPAVAQQLAGSEWRPTKIGDKKVPAGSEMFVRFGGEGKLEGHSGCNRFFGTFKLAGDGIEIGPLGVTRMACSDPAVMEREVRFLEALQNARQFMRDRIDLSLTDNAGNPVVQLIQTDAD
jgi:heat shock protein HslJ